MLSLFDVKYNTADTHICNTKKWSLKKAIAEISQTNILVLHRVSSVNNSLFNI